jgi:hypothetical protein
MRERWGSFSVADHTATERLVTDVLLYDRLVFPVPPDETERARWRQNGWEPELLDERLTQLRDRAIKVPWDEKNRHQFPKLWNAYEHWQQIQKQSLMTSIFK